MFKPFTILLISDMDGSTSVADIIPISGDDKYFDMCGSPILQQQYFFGEFVNTGTESEIDKLIAQFSLVEIIISLTRSLTRKPWGILHSCASYRNSKSRRHRVVPLY